MASFRMLGDILASCVIHGGLIAAVFLCSGTRSEAPQEKIYRVSLADVAISGKADTSFSPVSEPAAPQPEPVAETPREKPAVPPQAPREKSGSTKKRTIIHKPSAAEAPARHAATESPGPVAEAGPSGGGPPLHIGGLAAYEEGAVDQPPSVAIQVIPEYPQRARRMGVEGRVEIRLVVDSEGKPQACTVHTAEPAGYFEEAALTAALKTRFLPGKLRGFPVNTLVHISFVFVLR